MASKDNKMVRGGFKGFKTGNKHVNNNISYFKSGFKAGLAKIDYTTIDFHNLILDLFMEYNSEKYVEDGLELVYKRLKKQFNLK